MTKQEQAIELTEQSARRLIADAVVLAAAVKIYAPRERKDAARAQAAADRILRKFMGIKG